MMKINKTLRIRTARAVLSAAVLVFTVFSGASAADLKFDRDFPTELLLSPEIFKMYKMQNAMDSFEKLPGDGFLIGAGGHIVTTAEWGSLLKQPHPELRSFRLLSDGSLLAVTRRKTKTGTQAYLAYLEDGQLHEEVQIPDPDMKISVSADSSEFYLYGGKAAANVVYRFKPKEKYEVAVNVSGAVGALAGDRKNGLYLAIEDEIFEIPPNSKVRLMARLKGKKIESLAYDAAGGGCLFASVKDTVLLLKPDSVRTVLTGMGGTLRIRDGRLFVFDRNKKMIVEVDYSRFRSNDAAIEAEAPGGAANNKRK